MLAARDDLNLKNIQFFLDSHDGLFLKALWTDTCNELESFVSLRATIKEELVRNLQGKCAAFIQWVGAHKFDPIAVDEDILKKGMELSKAAPIEVA